ncbi:hypothetical protein GCK32_006817 [Trichostrongylus colubriformis]|uniref:Uncharacterized protein n=1 Tax=Trichostrongylus colubriformis TaxID=6319 RepID=A0AAN8F0G9_TRICO
MPETIARFVDPAVLVAQMNSLNYSIGVLEKLETTMVQLNTTDFNDAFTTQYNITVDVVTPVIDDINEQQSNFSSALASSSSLHEQAALLTNKTDCFQAGLISSYCGNLV